jgi:hypothetical protein
MKLGTVEVGYVSFLAIIFGCNHMLLELDLAVAVGMLKSGSIFRAMNWLDTIPFDPEIA